MRSQQSDRLLVTPAASFRYDDLPASVARFLKTQVERIHQCARSSILKIGADLLVAKQHLSHGMFVRWVENEVGLPARTAQGYMQVAQWVETRGRRVAHLPPSILYVLSAPSTPPDFVDKVLSDFEAGEEISPKIIRTQLKTLRDASRKKRASRVNRIPAGDSGDSKIEVIDNDPISGAVAILACNLLPSKFRIVRGIMTSKDMLGDPELGERILAAFEAADSADHHTISICAGERSK